LRPPPWPNQHIRHHTHSLADPITRLRPPPWPNECHCHCRTPSHPIPYILHLRPLPWPPPTPTANKGLITIAIMQYSTQGKTAPWTLFFILYFLYINLQFHSLLFPINLTAY
jgi:hypothetical protein